MDIWLVTPSEPMRLWLSGRLWMKTRQISTYLMFNAQSTTEVIYQVDKGKGRGRGEGGGGGGATATSVIYTWYNHTSSNSGSMTVLWFTLRGWWSYGNISACEHYSVSVCRILWQWNYLRTNTETAVNYPNNVCTNTCSVRHNKRPLKTNKNDDVIVTAADKR